MDSCVWLAKPRWIFLSLKRRSLCAHWLLMTPEPSDWFLDKFLKLLKLR